jgi:putative transposase
LHPKTWVALRPRIRANGGSKRSLLTEANGIPVGLAVAGANVNDFELLLETVENVPVVRPKPTRERPQNLLDNGYDHQEPRELVAAFEFAAHIKARGEEVKAIKRRAGFRAPILSSPSQCLAVSWHSR